MSYIATDEDLPAIFWSDVPETVTPTDSGGAERYRAAAVTLHYPEFAISKSSQRRRAAALRSEREVSLTQRKVFVKLSKKCQMWDWLCGLFEADTIGQIRAEQSQRVLEFLTQLYAKFYRYTPYKVKWVTVKQYDWLKQIACQYLKVPNAK